MAKSLFDKTYIGKMKLKNKIFMSPMGTTGDAVAPRKILTAIHEGYHAIRVME